MFLSTHTNINLINVHLTVLSRVKNTRIFKPQLTSRSGYAKLRSEVCAFLDEVTRRPLLKEKYKLLVMFFKNFRIIGSLGDLRFDGFLIILV